MVNCTSAWFFSPIPPNSPHPPLIKDTLTYRQTLVSPTPHPFLPIPLPCQHKPVMWLSQIMRWEFYCTSLWGWQRLRPMRRLPGIRRPLLTPVGSHQTQTASLRSSSNALQSGRSRVDLRMTAREWQWLSQATPTATCQSQRHKGSRDAVLHGGSPHSGRGTFIHRGRGQCSVCILYKYWWVKSKVRGRGKKAVETEGQH